MSYFDRSSRHNHGRYIAVGGNSESLNNNYDEEVGTMESMVTTKRPEHGVTSYVQDSYMPTPPFANEENDEVITTTECMTMVKDDDLGETYTDDRHEEHGIESLERSTLQIRHNSEESTLFRTARTGIFVSASFCFVLGICYIILEAKYPEPYNENETLCRTRWWWWWWSTWCRIPFRERSPELLEMEELQATSE